MARHQNQPTPQKSYSSLASPYGAITFKASSVAPMTIPVSPCASVTVASQNAMDALSRYLPVKKMAKVYGDFISEAALRALIWSAEAYEKAPKAGLKSNGFLPVIVRPPNQRKVLLDRVEFENWLTSQQRNAR